MSRLDNLNQWVKSQPSKQIAMLLATLVVGIVLLIYLFLITPLMEKKAELEGQYNQAKRSLDALKSNQSNSQIESLQKILASTKSQSEELAFQAKLAKEHLNSMDELKHDNASWAAVLEQLLQNSVRLGVDIVAMEINSVESAYVGILSLHKHLHVEGSGDFLAIEKWIRNAENTPKIMKLKSLKINEGEIPSFEAQFEVLGLLR